MTDEQKALAYYRNAAVQHRTNDKPMWVPSRVRICRNVLGDGIYATLGIGPGDYDCHSNKWGAVSVKATNGQELGLRLDEFEPLAWRANE